MRSFQSFLTKPSLRNDAKHFGSMFCFGGVFHFRLDNKAAAELFLIYLPPLRHFQCIIVKYRI